MGLEVDTCPATDRQQSPLGRAVQRRALGAQAVIPRKIEQVKSPLQEVSRQLAKIGSPGSFATRLTVAAGDLHLEAQGVESSRRWTEPYLLCQQPRRSRASDFTRGI